MDAKGKKTIASLDSRVRNLEAILTNEREHHKSEIHVLNSLIQQKDAAIRVMKKELEERPTTELVDQMRQQLTVLLARISEKSNLLEAAENKITKLTEEVTERENLITEIETELEETLTQIHGDNSAELKNFQKTNEIQEPIVPVTKKLTFFTSPSLTYDLSDLLNSSAEVLGKGTFGATYKITLNSGLTLVVKRLREVQLPESEFRRGVERIGELEHENLMPLNAYYYSKDETLLVYDFVTSLADVLHVQLPETEFRQGVERIGELEHGNLMPLNAYYYSKDETLLVYDFVTSVADVLHGNQTSNKVPLNWASRANIALTSARGISHIHSLSPFSSHGNIKSSNILLSKSYKSHKSHESYESLVSDTGLYFLASPIPSRIKTLNRAPEITDPTKPSQKVDVYSFGVLLLELLTGRESQTVDLVKWVQYELRDGWVNQVIDEELLRDGNVKDEELVEFLQIAIDCTERFPELRPLMHVVEARIEAILE